jgi:hypothetical protein|tara:strand:+ start:2094 stop:2672 length:579 start_codon:yes stop_codon:yes gene_type:complete
MVVKEHKEPWQHFIIEDFFPQELYQSIKNTPPLDVDYNTISGFRDTLQGRVFFSNDYIKENPHIHPVCEFLNNKTEWEKYGCDLTNTLLRPELIDDRYPFFHQIHHDTPEKKITIIVNIDKEDEQNLATDLYKDKDTHSKKLEWKNNSAVLFIPTEDKLHGFDPIKYEGIRRIMIINFVDIDIWRNKTQCYY